MDMKKELFECFKDDVTSIDDYMCRIEKIKSVFGKKASDKFGIFYRGDRFCTRTQSDFFRSGDIRFEACNFNHWKSLKVGNESDEILQLAHMQHECGNTRLLDFSKDPLVALRFACGIKDTFNCPKKVTIYYTDYIDYANENSKDIISAFMKLVKSEDDEIHNFAKEEKTILGKDYFIDNMNLDFERIKRQKGLFLMMGNFENIESPKFCNEKKVKHELSPSIGRGEDYEGYVGVLRISPHYVNEIRDMLDNRSEYNIKYLMAYEK